MLVHQRVGSIASSWKVLSPDPNDSRKKFLKGIRPRLVEEIGLGSIAPLTLSRIVGVNDEMTAFRCIVSTSWYFRRRDLGVADPPQADHLCRCLPVTTRRTNTSLTHVRGFSIDSGDSGH
jgi:hypothetical protein